MPCIILQKALFAGVPHNKSLERTSGAIEGKGTERVNQSHLADAEDGAAEGRG
ncbi:hypothetical protein ES703_16796 [subsurface metagenome]